MESKRSVPKMVMTISTVMTVIEEVITGANCTQPYRHHNEEKYTKYINTQMHKITIFSKCFSKLETGSACSLRYSSDGLSSRVGATAVRHSVLQSEVKI